MVEKITLNKKDGWINNETPLSAENLNTMLNGIIDNKNKTIDQTYQPNSENPQSGKAVKQALDGYLPLTGGTLQANHPTTDSLSSEISITPYAIEDNAFTEIAADKYVIQHSEGARSELRTGCLELSGHSDLNEKIILNILESNIKLRSGQNNPSIEIEDTENNSNTVIKGSEIVLTGPHNNEDSLPIASLSAPGITGGSQAILRLNDLVITDNEVQGNNQAKQAWRDWLEVENSGSSSGPTEPITTNTSKVTLAELKNQLKSWISNNYQNIGASGYFFAPGDLANKWNTSPQSTAVLDRGQRWAITIVSNYNKDDHIQARFSTYSDKTVYFARLNLNGWSQMHRVAFIDETNTTSFLNMKSATPDGTVGINLAQGSTDKFSVRVSKNTDDTSEPSRFSIYDNIGNKSVVVVKSENEVKIDAYQGYEETGERGTNTGMYIGSAVWPEDKEVQSASDLQFRLRKVIHEGNINEYAMPALKPPAPISTTFSDNDWETIAWVAKNDDPSKYWNVGDYKMLTYKQASITNSSILFGQYVVTATGGADYLVLNNQTKLLKQLEFEPGRYLLTSSDPRSSNISVYKNDQLLFHISKSELGVDWSDTTEGTCECHIQVGYPDDFLTYRSYTSNGSYSFRMPTLYSLDGENVATVDGYLRIKDIEKFKKFLESKEIPLDKEYTFRIARNSDGLIIRYKDVGMSNTTDISTGVSLSQDIEWLTGIDLHINFDTYQRAHGLHCGSTYVLFQNKEYDLTPKQYPIMIWGFNHDRTSDKSTYGRAKAGLTLGVGVTRAFTPSSPPTYWDGLQTNVFEDIFYMHPTDGLKQFPFVDDTGNYLMPIYVESGQKNSAKISYLDTWENSLIREAMQNMFSHTEIGDFITPVIKRTATSQLQPTTNYYGSVYTNDSVFLPSENELNGITITGSGNANTVFGSNINTTAIITNNNSLAPEGKWYEVFESGYSRFFWDSKFINKQDINVNLWTRSKCRISSVNTQSNGVYLSCNAVMPSIEVYDNFGLDYEIQIDSRVFINHISSIVPNYKYDEEHVIQTEDNTNWKLILIDDNNTEVSYNIGTTSQLGITWLREPAPDQPSGFSIAFGTPTQVGYRSYGSLGSDSGYILPMFCL